MSTLPSLRGRKAWMATLIALMLLTACAPQPTQISATTTPTNPVVVVPQVIVPAAPNNATTSPTSTPVSSPAPALPAASATPSLMPTATPSPRPVPQWKEVASGLDRPTVLVEIPDGSGRLAVAEQGGVIRILKKTGGLQPQAYLDLSSQVTTRNVEQGLLGLAFHPKFAINGFFFVYTTDASGNIVVARYHASPSADSAEPNSAKVLLKINKQFPNHNGGQLAFGTDGYLYIGVGDGGSEGDPQQHGQSLTTLLGKILRLEVDRSDPYSVPETNPYVKGGGLKEIYEVGLRNPWRFSFDSVTGDLYIGDVGQNQYEEIDFVAAGSQGGLNFGWSYREGFHPYKGNPPAGLKLVDPVWEYGHDQGCAVVGGYVYRGQQLPGLMGVYLYGDNCSGMVWGLKQDASGKWVNALLSQTRVNISSFGQDLSGEIYLLDLTGGRVLRLSGN